jgi:homoserine kinase type II
MAGQVLMAYPAPLRVGPVVRFAFHGGFTGASIFQVDNPCARLCLRGWLPRETDPKRLAWLHRLMADAGDGGLEFVPRVLAALAGGTIVRHEGRLWELQEWLPWRPDFCERPSAAKLENACISLAQLHSRWRLIGTDATEELPAVHRRLECLRRSGAHAAPLRATGLDGVKWNALQILADRARIVLPHWLAKVDTWLEPWAQVTGQLQACLCDIWHNHVLLEGDRVTGIIDYGAVKVDHPAVDVARMLGSLAEDDDTAWQRGLAAYRSVRAFSQEEERLAHVLDATGTVLGVANWLARLGEKRTVAEQEAVAKRLEKLVRRLERWEKQIPLAAH